MLDAAILIVRARKICLERKEKEPREGYFDETVRQINAMLQRFLSEENEINMNKGRTWKDHSIRDLITESF